MSRPPCTESRRRGADGSVLLWALLFTVITSAMIITHATYLAANRREMHVRFEHQTLADNFARAGLTDALVWFQKQPNQPVTAFAPHYAPNADPPLLETLDPTVGLVREFEVRGNLWARYEVRTGEAFDISAERGIEQSGSVWDVGARAYLYEKEDPSASFNQSPNRVIASDYLRSEMRGIPILPPAVAAVSIDDPTQLDVGPLGHIVGGSAPAVAYPAPPPGPPPSFSLGGLLSQPLSTLTLTLSSLLVTGTPTTLALVSYEPSATDVFSMQLDQLKTIADFVFEAGDAGTVGATTSGTGGDGNASALAVATFSSPQGGGTSGSGSGSTSVNSGPGSINSGRNKQSSTTTTTTQSAGLLNWVSSVVTNVSTLTTTTTSTLPQLSTTLSTVGTSTTNLLGWASTGGARLAAGTGQTALRLATRILRGRAVFVDGDLVLDATTPLKGRALLIVRGNLTVRDGNATDLQGLVYVTGDAVIDGAFHLEGTMVVRGQMKIGYGSQTVSIQFNQTALDMLKKDLERYRLSRSVRPGWTR